MYKVKNKISPLPMQELFTKQTNVIDLRNKRCWKIPSARTVHYGTESPKHGNSYQLKPKIPNHYENLNRGMVAIVYNFNREGFILFYFL